MAMSESKKEKFCSHLKDMIRDESKATGEYMAMSLESLEALDPVSAAVSILLEKIRDDESSHYEALKRVRSLVCPLK